MNESNDSNFLQFFDEEQRMNVREHLFDFTMDVTTNYAEEHIRPFDSAQYETIVGELFSLTALLAKDFRAQLVMNDQVFNEFWDELEFILHEQADKAVVFNLQEIAQDFSTNASEKIRSLNELIKVYGIKLAIEKAEDKPLRKWGLCLIDVCERLRDQCKESMIANVGIHESTPGAGAMSQSLIALTHVYLNHAGDGPAINGSNMNSVAQQYGFMKRNSGQSLKDEFAKFSLATNRKELAGNLRSDNNHKNRLEKTLKYLSSKNFPGAHARAKSEYDIFIARYNSVYT